MSEVMGKSIRLLYALIPNGEEREWSATEVSKRLEMPVQTVHRLLSSLAKYGLVEKNKKTRKYRLGLAVMQLGLLLWENLSIRSVARQAMERLAERTRESVYLTVRDGTDGIFVDCIDSPQLLKIAEPLGMRKPLSTGASKKVILAYISSYTQEGIIRELISKGELGEEEEGHLKEELNQIRKQGYAISIGETTANTAGIAAPIFSWENQVMGAISIAGPEARFTGTKLREGIALVRSAAIEISEELGWIGQRSYEE